MVTSVAVENANCTYCFNDARERLLQHPAVQRVELDQSNGCLEVEHGFSDPRSVTDLLQQTLRGWMVASNGEVEMVATEPTLTRSCVTHN